MECKERVLTAIKEWQYVYSLGEEDEEAKIARMILGDIKDALLGKGEYADGDDDVQPD